MASSNSVTAVSDQKPDNNNYHPGDYARINAEVRAARWGKPSGAVKGLTVERRVLQYETAKAQSSS